MAKLYWAWAREGAPGLSSLDVPLSVCERELELAAAQPFEPRERVSGADLLPDWVVLEVRPFEVQVGMTAGFYRLAERRSDAVIQRLLRSF